jgi:hypothetical protein
MDSSPQESDEMNYPRVRLIIGIGCTALSLAQPCSAYNKTHSITSNQAQTKQARPEPEAASADFGEYTSLKLDEIIAEVLQTGSTVIIISRLGTGDTRANLHHRRLHNAVARLVDYKKAIPREQVVTALGNRVKGGGKVEFYVNGRLVYIVVFKPNADFRVDCCDEDPLYYPWRKEPAKSASLRNNE